MVVSTVGESPCSEYIPNLTYVMCVYYTYIYLFGFINVNVCFGHDS